MLVIIIVIIDSFDKRLTDRNPEETHHGK